MEIAIGQRITAWRTHAGRSLTECADVMGLHKSGLSRVESGKQRVTSDQLERLVAYLDGFLDDGLSMAEFYERVPAAPKTRAAR